MAIIEVRAWDTTLAERSTGIKRVVIANQLNIPPQLIRGAGGNPQIILITPPACDAQGNGLVVYVPSTRPSLNIFRGTLFDEYKYVTSASAAGISGRAIYRTPTCSLGCRPNVQRKEYRASEQQPHEVWLRREHRMAIE